MHHTRKTKTYIDYMSTSEQTGHNPLTHSFFWGKIAP